MKWLNHLQPLVSLHRSLYLLETIWLFTYSDLKTIVGPQSAFGVLAALAANIFEQSSTPGPSAYSVLSRLPVTVLWTYINLLPFAISNQRHPLAVTEDATNKPWRPLPSGRLESSQALGLMLILYVSAMISSFYLGGLKQCVALVILGYCYNDVGGADKSFVLRNLINACGFVSFASGAMEISLGRNLLWTEPLLQWFAFVALIVFTTVQSQDMYDVEGDSLRGRRTVPLVFGDNVARWSIAMPVIFFTLSCTWFWDMPLRLCLLQVFLGSTVALRTLCCAGVKADKTTFALWNLWLVSLYCLPVLKYFFGP